MKPHARRVAGASASLPRLLDAITIDYFIVLRKAVSSASPKRRGA